MRAANGFFQVERTCPRCGGAGRMVADPCTDLPRPRPGAQEPQAAAARIPAGVDDGSRIRLSGEGDAGPRGGPRGDLYVFLSVTPHELFERDNLDLLVTVPVPMCTAALGGEIEAPCLIVRGLRRPAARPRSASPQGAQTGKTVRIKGKGMPHLNGRQRGDLVVELFVETPTDLTARQKELMRELAESCGEKQHPRNAGFLKKARRFWDDLTGEAGA